MRLLRNVYAWVRQTLLFRFMVFCGYVVHPAKDRSSRNIEWFYQYTMVKIETVRNNLFPSLRKIMYIGARFTKSSTCIYILRSSRSCMSFFSHSLKKHWDAMININSVSILKKRNFTLLVYDVYPLTSVRNNVLASSLLHRVLRLLIYPRVKT